MHFVDLVGSKLFVMYVVTFFEQVPASVRVRRESALPKGKPKPQASASAPRPSPAAAGKLESTAMPAGSKGQSVDDSYMAFLEEMKELGALDG